MVHFTFCLYWASFFAPRFEHLDRAALGGQLNVGIDGVDLATAGMPHQGFADFLHDSRFHQAGIKGVA